MHDAGQCNCQVYREKNHKHWRKNGSETKPRKEGQDGNKKSRNGDDDYFQIFFLVVKGYCIPVLVPIG